MDNEKMYSVTCDPSCGFMVRSHDKEEVVAMAEKHMMDMHPDMPMTHDDVEKMVKTA